MSTRPGPPRHRRRFAGQHGQAAVELALGLPVVLLALLAVVQVVLVARDQVAVVHAAREGARAAALDPGDAQAAAGRALGLDPSRASVAVRAGPTTVSVTVQYRSPTDVPFVGALLGDVELSATATMRREPGPDP